jgi:ribose transport system ATP-binding protein
MNPILKLDNITKIYGGIRALNNVSMSFDMGEVHAIVGENGAGKSTLIKTISGAITPNNGEINIDGDSFTHLNPKLSKDLGVEVIYQEFNLIESLTAAENIFLGERFGYFVDYKLLADKAKEMFDKFKVNINPNSLVENLSPAQKQIVEILKAISRKAKIIIMDEPTAPLTNNEVESLFEIVEELKREKITVIYITHRLPEIFRIADRVSVLRDGEYIGTKPVKDTTVRELVKKMVGRDVMHRETNPDYTQKEVSLSIKNYSGNGLENISLDIHKGEILGLFGLVGAGRTELARLIYGVDKRLSGSTYINGEYVNYRSTAKAIKLGIGMIPEDRKNDGCFLDNSISWNITISAIKELSNGPFINDKLNKEMYEKFSESLKIKASGPNQLVKNLSGGN